MNKKRNLHFLLALGNIKMVVLKQDEQLEVYSKETQHKTVSSARVTEALSTR